MLKFFKTKKIVFSTALLTVVLTSIITLTQFYSEHLNQQIESENALVFKTFLEAATMNAAYSGNVSMIDLLARETEFCFNAKTEKDKYECAQNKISLDSELKRRENFVPNLDQASKNIDLVINQRDLVVTKNIPWINLLSRIFYLCTFFIILLAINFNENKSKS